MPSPADCTAPVSGTGVFLGFDDATKTSDVGFSAVSGSGTDCSSGSGAVISSGLGKISFSGVASGFKSGSGGFDTSRFSAISSKELLIVTTSFTSSFEI